MSRPVQIAIDCHDPHAQKRFWAEVMDYEIEDHHEQIEQLLAGGMVGLDETPADRRSSGVGRSCRVR